MEQYIMIILDVDYFRGISNSDNCMWSFAKWSSDIPGRVKINIELLDKETILSMGKTDLGFRNR